MKRIAVTGAFILAVGIGVDVIGRQAASAQQATDLRVADLVRAGRVRVGLGLGVPTVAIKDPATGKVRGPALELGRALAARIGIEFAPVEYPRPGAVMEGVRTGAWDVAFLGIDPSRTTEGDFSPPYMEYDLTFMVPAGSSVRNVADADQPGIRIAVERGAAWTRACERGVAWRAGDGCSGMVQSSGGRARSYELSPAGRLDHARCPRSAARACAAHGRAAGRKRRARSQR